jgi:hypothetical protein
MVFDQEIREAFDKTVNSPIAARLRADHGWRAVVFNKQSAPDENGLYQLTIEIVQLKQWALSTPAWEPERIDTNDVLELGSLFTTTMRRPPSHLWPIDPRSGKRFGVELHRLVPPAADGEVMKTDDRLIEEARLWCAETVVLAEKQEGLKKKPTP